MTVIFSDFPMLFISLTGNSPCPVAKLRVPKSRWNSGTAGLCVSVSGCRGNVADEIMELFLMHVSNIWLVPPLAYSDVQTEDSRNAPTSVYVYSLLNAHVKMLCMWLYGLNVLVLH